MNICFITPSLEKGGMERVLVELANYGVNSGYDISIIAILPNRDIAYELDPRVNYISPSYGYSKGMSFKIHSVIFLKGTIKRISPDVCLSFSETFNPLSIIACKLNKIPIYISDRSNPAKSVSFYKNELKKRLYPLANGIIAQTKFAKDIFQKRKLNQNILVIPNPLRKVAEKQTGQPKTEKKVVISVGRLVPSKNFTRLIHMFQKVYTLGWELWILGEGQEFNVLQEVIEKLNLVGIVKLLGQTDDVDQYLAVADIFAFTSLSEGFPNALSEAMAIPLPCIAFDCPAGPSDIIKNEINGFLIPVGDEELYLERLKSLMSDHKLRSRFAQEAYLNRQKFSVDNTSKQYFKFITNK